jgi:hypothetical protein
MEQACLDKLEGKISEEFWFGESDGWKHQQSQALMAIQGLKQSSPDSLLDATKILELANKVHFLYLRQFRGEKAKLWGALRSNHTIDASSFCATYRKPFDLIFTWTKNEGWRDRRDSNSRSMVDQLLNCSHPIV